MRRTWVFALALGLALVACKDKDKAPAHAATASAARPIEPPAGPAPKLAWKDTDGELLLATSDGKTVTGPCGLTGTMTATEIEIAGQPKETWTRLLRDGRKFSMPKLDWTIEVLPTGEVVFDQHGAKKSLGQVTGLDDDAALAWFGAFVAAAPMVQHTLELHTNDGTKLVLGGAADLRSWEVKGADGARIASRQRNDPAPLLAAGDKPAWEPTKIDVKIDVAKQYDVFVQRDDAATKAAFTADRYRVTEAADGALTWAPMTGGKVGAMKPLAKLVGRVACRAHDQAIPALLWTLFASSAGHAKVFGS